MPGGIDHPAVGYLTFCAVKFAGYSIAARFLSHRYARTDRNSLVVGGARTLIGMAAGAGCYAVLCAFPRITGPSGLGYVAGLVPVRIAEWWLLLWLFYDRPLRQKAKDWRMAALGTVWSFVLDVPALVGLFFTGGLWVC
jgi:hypothetical protein